MTLRELILPMYGNDTIIEVITRRYGKEKGVDFVKLVENATEEELKTNYENSEIMNYQVVWFSVGSGRMLIRVDQKEN